MLGIDYRREESKFAMNEEEILSFLYEKLLICCMQFHLILFLLFFFTFLFCLVNLDFEFLTFNSLLDYAPLIFWFSRVFFFFFFQLFISYSVWNSNHQWTTNNCTTILFARFVQNVSMFQIPN